MCNWRDRLRLVVSACLLSALVAMHGFAAATERFPGIGRPATASEVAAWDIDVRPDFKGLPNGSGSVAAGQDVWENKCASCHGVFGESNQVFTPIVGGTTAEDIRTGRVARLTDAAYPGRTTLMKLPTLSTLWDYINRAMPWNQPKSLSADEVYAVTAFILHLGDVVPATFTLSNQNMAQVQARLPNRLGMTTSHALWPDASLGGITRPDVLARACVRDCLPVAAVSSSLPDFARNQHGNLAEQNRLVGPQRGADTNRGELRQALVTGASAGAPAPVVPVVAAKPVPAADGGTKVAIALAGKYACTACHGMAQKIVGPGFSEIARKHAGKTEYLTGKIREGGSGVWGPIPMPSQTLSEADARTIAVWLAAGAAK